MPEPRVSVVVPVKDRRDQMLRCLDALLAQDGGDYEVLVLDNGSTDGTAEACRERAAAAPVPVRVERVDGPVGRVRNAGARLARGAIVAFTDSDCVPEPGWLRAGTAALAADPRLAVVCGRTVAAEEAQRGWPAWVQVREMTWRFESCNVFFRRDALLDGGGFGEQGFGWEDTAAGWATLERGWQAAFCPDAVVRHDVTYPGYVWHLRRAQQHRYAAGVVRRHPGARKALWAGVFLHRRHAALLAALVGATLAVRHPAALVLVAPYAWRRRPRGLQPAQLKAAVQLVVFDAATMGAMARGAISARTLVI